MEIPRAACWETSNAIQGDAAASSTIVEAQRHTVAPAIASLSVPPPSLLFVFWMSLL